MSQVVFNQFIADTRAKLIEAVEKYNLPFDPLRVKIRLDIRGECAGQARRNGSQYELRFNPEAIIEYNEDMTKDVIPHEVAHLVCFARRDLGKDHDAGWKRVCRQLGGDDSRTHDMTLTKAKHKTIWRFEYNVNGEKIMVGPKHHKRIQATYPSMSTIQSRRTGAKITRDHFVRAYADGQPQLSIQRGNMPSSIPANVQLAAKQPRVVPTAGKTKRQLAEEIMAANPSATRAQIIQMFIDQAAMTKNGAATYYYNIKNGK